MKYVVDELEDIADFFANRAENEMKLLESAKPTEATIIKARAVTWMAAADFVGNCELTHKSVS
jgi:hypothetical protein